MESNLFFRLRTSAAAKSKDWTLCACTASTFVLSDLSLQSQRLQIALVDPAIREFNALEIIAQRFLYLLLRWPILSHFFEGRARAFSKGYDRHPFRGRVYLGDARRRVQPFIRPETPADVVLLEQRPERRN